jgi:hypothetical protein
MHGPPPAEGDASPPAKKPLTLVRALAAGLVSAGPVPARTGPARASACFRSPPSPPPPGQSWALPGCPIAPSPGGTPGPPCCKPCTTRLGCARRRSCGPERISAPYLAHRGRPPPQEVGGPTPGGVAASGQPPLPPIPTTAPLPAQLSSSAGPPSSPAATLVVIECPRPSASPRAAAAYCAASSMQRVHDVVPGPPKSRLGVVPQ